MGTEERKNINRKFRQLRVWNDAIELDITSCRMLSVFPFELKKVASDCIDASHSISRIIAEGYVRRSMKEYLQFLNAALGSCGEFYFCIQRSLSAKQIIEVEFEELDKLHFKTENEPIRLIKSL